MTTSPCSSRLLPE